MSGPVLSNVYLERIGAQLGIDPDKVTRVVIDLQAGDIAMAYVVGYATLPPDIDLLDGVTIAGGPSEMDALRRGHTPEAEQ